MDITDWRERRSAAMHHFRGAVTMITRMFENGSYTALEAMRELRNADAEVTRKFKAIDAAWDAEKEQAS